ncbi:cob(I)yrinic acid a,c-diamide adenosyltransferase [Desulfonatronum sp. SC1]|uniref:cob(I)yrinic acid a,c-diamide adenosyltransferase n=1 Tax=Desulfonatronum sp. SC1 TaxID=2109626 RepID=UPI000D30CF46|nr:cob(I)yrinic acid a,c-diamide adenosyltransferase [Desulfonatronum sp. SC1]PTN35160.1 cob(I)alamin adenolsyltransferase [Desulfonatronum sp. SC1]
MIVVYTGDGKGKTSAALGQILRALGHDLRVACAQFMKRDDVAGEQRFLASLLGDDFLVGGLGFFRDNQDWTRHREAALTTLDWASAKVAADVVQVLVLDEVLYALGAGVLEQEELQALLDRARERNVHLIMTGRGLPEWLGRQADLITEMLPVKHPFNQGQGALKGIDF